VGLLPLAFFEWCQTCDLIAAMRSVKWLFPAIQGLHLMGFALIGGPLLMVNLSLLGCGLRREPLAQVAREAQWWLIVSLFVIAPTGALLFMSEAVKCYQYAAFWIKMATLLAALIFTFTVHRRVAMADEARVRPVWRKTVAVASLSLWTGVGIAGRLIGFS
jgi:hypothetical protein